MNEFKKPYEYTEEKKGFILFFVIAVVIIDILQWPGYIIPVSNKLSQFPALSKIYIPIAVFHLLFSIFIAIVCFTLQKGMLTVSKIYLFVRLLIPIFSIIVIYLTSQDTLVGFDSKYKNLQTYTIFELVFPLCFELLFSIGWYIYFMKSKKCKEFAMSSKNKSLAI